MILHTVNKAPAGNGSLRTCLGLAGQGDAVLLLEDGVYAALDCAANRALLADFPAPPKLYVLEPDLRARGIVRVLPQCERVGYERFVELCTLHARVQSWF